MTANAKVGVRKGRSWINGKATEFGFHSAGPVLGLASQGADERPQDQARPWTRPDHKRPQAQSRSNGSQGIPEVSDLEGRVRRGTKQCLAHATTSWQ